MTELAPKLQEKNTVTYKSGDDEITLTPSVVTQFVTKGNGTISTEEAYNFIQLCRYNGLNPFLNEAYIIKFGTMPAQLIVSKEAFMKRAERQASYQGFEAGIIVYNDKKDEIIEREGAFKTRAEEIIGGWAKVYRSDRERPVTVKIGFEEFAKYKNGSLQSTWAQMPANMIRKSAIVNALREAYPDQLNAMYTEDDANPQEVQQGHREKPAEKTQELLSDFKASEPDKPAEKQPEPTQEEVKEVKDVTPKEAEETPETAQKTDLIGDFLGEQEVEEVTLFETGVKSKLD